MPLKKTIFDHQSEPRHTWVQARIILSKTEVKRISLRLTEIPTLEGTFKGSYEITDFRAPDHPEINWEWLDTHAQKVWAAVEFSS